MDPKVSGILLGRLGALGRTWAVLEDQPHEGFGNYNLVESRYVRVDELSVVVDLPGEVGVVLVGRLQHDLQSGE